MRMRDNGYAKEISHGRKAASNNEGLIKASKGLAVLFLRSSAFLSPFGESEIRH